MRAGLRSKLLVWFAIVLVPIVAILTFLAWTTHSVGSGFAEARAVDDLDQSVRQVLLWTTDYSLTWRPESLQTARGWAERYWETSRLLRVQGQVARNAAVLDELDRGFESYWKVALEMADTYIKADRVAGNAFTDRFHSHAKQLEDTVKRLNDDVTQRMQSDLSQGTRLAIASAVLIVGVFVAGALAISAGLVRRIQALLRAPQDIPEGDGGLTKGLELSSADEIRERAPGVHR